jgi:hypothetical protein
VRDEGVRKVQSQSGRQQIQGQQTPVVFFAMASSNSDDVPRGPDFLFSRNDSTWRSRARMSRVLVCLLRLLDANRVPVKQMRLANALCRLAEYTSAR